MLNQIYKIQSALRHPAQTWINIHFQKRSALLLDQLRQINLPQKGQGRHIVFANIRNASFYTLFDYSLALLFSRQGYRCSILIDDGCLLHHDVVLPTKCSLKEAMAQIEERQSDLRKHKGMVSIFPQPMGTDPNIRFIFYSQILETVEPRLALDFRSQALPSQPVESLSSHALASHNRFFGGRRFDPTHVLHQKYAQWSYANQTISRWIGDYLIKNDKPDLLITLDGAYSIHGTLIDQMRVENIPVQIYQPNGFQDRHIFVGDTYYGIFQGGSHWKQFKEKVYDKQWAGRIEIFFKDRILDRMNHPSDIDRIWIKRINKLKKTYRKTIALFPNLTWDGAVAERNTIFSGLQDWLEQTIQWAKDRNILLIVREHPQSCEKYGSFHSTLAMLKEGNTDLNSQANLLFIPALEQVSSYVLVDRTVDLSVVYNGTIGVEIPYLGYPVVFAGNSPYTQKGVGYEPASNREYFELLEDVSVSGMPYSEQQDRKENAKQAAAYQILYNSYYFPLMPNLKDLSRTKNKYTQHWDLRPQSLDPLQNRELGRTLERFLCPLNEKATTKASSLVLV